MPTDGKATALVLAGKRDGATDPLAQAAGVTHKCLVPVAGQPMLVHVIDALAASERIGQIRVAIEEPAVLQDLPQLRGVIATRRLMPVAAQPNLVDSVLAGAQGATFPLLITTADNVLLTPDSVAAELLDAIYDVDPSINAFCLIDRERTCAEARESTERFAAGTPLGPLDGVPVSIKDLLLTADVGVAPTQQVVDNLRTRLRVGGEEAAVTLLRDQADDVEVGHGEGGGAWGEQPRRALADGPVQGTTRGRMARQRAQTQRGGRREATRLGGNRRSGG